MKERLRTENAALAKTMDEYKRHLERIQELRRANEAKLAEIMQIQQQEAELTARKPPRTERRRTTGRRCPDNPKKA